MGGVLGGGRADNRHWLAIDWLSHKDGALGRGRGGAAVLSSSSVLLSLLLWSRLRVMSEVKGQRGSGRRDVLRLFLTLRLVTV